MTEQNWIAQGLVAGQEPTITNALLPAEEKNESPEPSGERKQWITDLRLQMEISAQAASTCKRLRRRSF